MPTIFVNLLPLRSKTRKNVHQILNLGLRFLIIIISIYIFTHILKKNLKNYIQKYNQGGFEVENVISNSAPIIIRGWDFSLSLTPYLFIPPQIRLIRIASPQGIPPRQIAISNHIMWCHVRRVI